MAELDPHYYPNLKDNLDKIALDNITSVTLNTDALKVNFEAIVTILKGLVKRADIDKDSADQTNQEVKDLKEKLQQLEDKQTNDKSELNNKISDTNSQLKDVQDNTDKNTQDIEKLQDALKELRDLKDSHNDLLKAHDNAQNDLNSAKEKLENHENQIQNLLEQLNSNNSNNSEERRNDTEQRKPNTPPTVQIGDSSNSRRDVDDMRKNFENQISELHKLLEDFVKKDEFNDHKDQANNKLDNHQASINDLYNQISDLSSRISDKLDCENFDEHIGDYNNIKNLVITLANKDGGADLKTTTVVQQLVQSGSSLSTKDANLLKELSQKFPEFEALLKKLNKEFSEHVITYRTFADEANRKIHNNDENIKNLKSETGKKISDLEAAMRSLRDQLLNFNAPLPVPSAGGSSNNSSNQVSNDNQSAEIRRIQMALTTINERISGVEKDVSDLQRLKEKVHSIQEVTYENKHKIGNIEEELAELRSLKARVELLEQIFREREREIKSSGGKGGRGSTADNGLAVGGVSLEQVKQMIDEETRKLRDELLALIDALRAELAKKADAEDLWKSEAALLEKLDQIAGALMKRSQADKSDTKKALMFLEKKIKEITVVLFGAPAQGEDGAMFSKKPWNPWSCASCDSKLKDFPGALVDHKNWNKLPPRETSPGRMTQGKFGKGWTKWADNKKSSAEKTREPLSGGSASKGDTLPEINNRDHAKGQMESSARIHE